MELYKMFVGFVGLSLDFSRGFSKTLDLGHCLDPISLPSFFSQGHNGVIGFVVSAEVVS